MMYEEDDIHDDDSDMDDDMMISPILSSKEFAAFRRAGFGKWLGNPRPVVYERLIIFAQSTHTGRSRVIRHHFIVSACERVYDAFVRIRAPFTTTTNRGITSCHNQTS